MTHWYTPKLALRTGFRAVLASIFGTFADRREALAATNPVTSSAFDPEMDFSAAAAEDGLWLDYIADTGDGYDATYAMARMLSAEALEVSGFDRDLPRARVLIMGGDQVYPDPSRQQYQERLLDPLERASDEASMPTEDCPSLFALPGNHDWYDGLVAFSSLFCRRRIAIPEEATIARPGRLIAGWKTHQTRSYFALRLTENWWIWAVDSQLSGYVDKSQIEYFSYIGRHWMAPNTNVILAVSTPAWVGEKTMIDRTTFNSFDYISRLAERMHNADGEELNHRVRLILTGDHHHYARYEEEASADKGGTPRNLIVAGGGGAFLHPTHHLDREERHTLAPAAQEASGRKVRAFRIAGSGQTEAVFPSRDDSRRLSYRNLMFAWLNPGMTLTYLVIYLLFIWTLSVWSLAVHDETLLSYIGNAGWGDALQRYFGLVLIAPFHMALILVSAAAYIYFCGPVKTSVALVSGGLHWAAQTFGALLAGWAAMQVGALVADVGNAPTVWQEALITLLGATLAAVTSATIIGLYLLIQLNVFNRHYNEAFSSIRVDAFRSFLRMHIDKTGRLTLYPIGLQHIPDASEPPRPLKPGAIEQPIIFEP